MPILSNILIEAKQEGAEIVATDLEIGMRGLYKATVHKAGGITVSARKLYEIIKELPSGDIDLISSENNWTTIKRGRASSRSSAFPARIIQRFPPSTVKG